MHSLLTCVNRLVLKSSFYLSTKHNTFKHFSKSIITLQLHSIVRYSHSRPACGISRSEIMNPLMDEKVQDSLEKLGITCETDPLKTLYVCSDENSLKISFLYNVAGSKKTFNLLRSKDESVELALNRLKLNVGKYSCKRVKREDGEAHEFEISLLRDGKNVAGDEKNIDAWVDGTVLKINDKEYSIIKNCPHVRDIHIPTVLMSRFPVLAKVQLVNCDIETSKFLWFRIIASHEKKAISPEEIAKLIFYNNMYWYLVSTKLHYVATNEDIGHKLILVSVPSDGVKQGSIQYYQTRDHIKAGPQNCPYKRRQSHTQSRISDKEKFRVLTYNLLADVYADSKYSQNYLFKHCEPCYLDIDYRRLLMIDEIEGYNADIICLQEVDRKEFNYTYKPYFSVKNYECFFSEKGNTSEGVATIFDQNKFKLVNSHKIALSHLIDPDFVPSTQEILEEGGEISEAIEDEELAGGPAQLDHFILKDRESEDSISCFSKFNDIRKAIEENQSLKDRFCRRKTVLQATLVKSSHDDNDYVMIINTHLYFAPDADHIRLLQGSICLKYIEFLEDYYTKLIQESSDIKPTIRIIFCGDMNSTPDCGLYQLLTEGSASSDLEDWISNPKENVKGLSLKTNLRFYSAYGQIEYTNYTPLFHGCLDYIYYDCRNLTLESVVPQPSHQDITRTGGIPSDLFPSDHIALIANFGFVKRKAK